MSVGSVIGERSRVKPEAHGPGGILRELRSGHLYGGHDRAGVDLKEDCPWSYGQLIVRMMLTFHPPTRLPRTRRLVHGHLLAFESATFWISNWTWA